MSKTPHGHRPCVVPGTPENSQSTGQSTGQRTGQSTRQTQDVPGSEPWEDPGKDPGDEWRGGGTRDTGVFYTRMQRRGQGGLGRDPAASAPVQRDVGGTGGWRTPWNERSRKEARSTLTREVLKGSCSKEVSRRLDQDLHSRVWKKDGRQQVEVQTREAETELNEKCFPIKHWSRLLRGCTSPCTEVFRTQLDKAMRRPSWSCMRQMLDQRSSEVSPT